MPMDNRTSDSDWMFDVECDENGDVRVTASVRITEPCMLKEYGIPRPDPDVLMDFYIENYEPELADAWQGVDEKRLKTYFQNQGNTDVAENCVPLYIYLEEKRGYWSTYKKTFMGKTLERPCWTWVPRKGKWIFVQTKWSVARPEGWPTRAPGPQMGGGDGTPGGASRVFNLAAMSSAAPRFPALSPLLDPEELEELVDAAVVELRELQRRYEDTYSELERGSSWADTICEEYLERHPRDEGTDDGDTAWEERPVCRVAKEDVVQAFLGLKPEDPALCRQHVRSVSGEVYEVGYCGDEYEKARSLFEWVLSLENEALQQSIREQLRRLSSEDKELFRDWFPDHQHLLEE